MSGCKQQKEFLKGERRVLKAEFEKRRLKMEKEFGRKVSKKEAEVDFLERGLKDFAKGYRTGFCSGCEYRDECSKE